LSAGALGAPGAPVEGGGNKDEAHVDVCGGGGGVFGKPPQEWVLVVGMARPGDQVRILAARRPGMHPHSRGCW
jgi:hypothetical protein